MSIPRQQIEQVLDAGHPETALIGVPVSLLRELFRAASAPPAAFDPAQLAGKVPTIIGFDTGRDVVPA